MPKIKFSYENSEERSQFMELIAPLLRNAKIKENHNSEKHNRIHITYKNQPKKAEKD